MRAVLFTDVVGSTEFAREMGDARWSRLLAAQRRVMRARLKETRGREVDTAGDGFFAVFDRPADAVRCAFEMCRAVQELGLDIRAGVHFGEVEIAGPEVHGIVVHTGARVMGQAGAAELLVTDTVKDLVAGARFDLQERGTYELKGVPGTWQLYDVMSVDDRLRPAPIEPASVASERRDRVASSPVPVGGRRWAVPAALVLVVLVAVAVFVTNRPVETYTPPPGTVARIDAAERFDEPVALAPFPTGLAWGEGRLWTTDQQGQIYWLDPASGDMGSRGTAGSPTGVAVGGGAVWITNGFGIGSGPMGGVSELDPVSGSLAPAFETPVGSEAIVWGADQVWVADTNTGDVRVFDPGTRTTDVIALPASSGPAPRPVALAYSDAQGGTVWVGDAAQGRVFRIPTADPSTIEALAVKTPVTDIAVSDGQIWVTGGDEDAVTVLDSASGSVLTTLDVASHGCDRPDAIVAAPDAIWVGCSVSRTVIQIDPAGWSMSDSLRLDGRPVALVTQGDGSAWVAVGPP